MKEGHYRIRIRRKNDEIEVEGSRDFVESNISELNASVFGTIPLDNGEITPPSTSPERRVRNDAELKEFYLSKKPGKHVDRVLTFVYWLQFKENVKEPTIEQIEECYDRLSVPKPANVADVNKKLRNKKPPLLLKGKKRGTCRLSINGEEFVKSMLPRQKAQE